MSTMDEAASTTDSLGSLRASFLHRNTICPLFLLIPHVILPPNCLGNMAQNWLKINMYFGSSEAGSRQNAPPAGRLQRGPSRVPPAPPRHHPEPVLSSPRTVSASPKQCTVRLQSTTVLAGATRGQPHALSVIVPGTIHGTA